MKTGIDLGTTFSLVAGLQNDGSPRLLPDNTFRDLFSTPSAVNISNQTAAVGYMVDTLLEENPDLPVVRFFKRSFGDTQPIYYDKQGNGWLGETMGALVLKKLKFDVEAFMGQGITGSVVTVPAHFNDVQRKAVKNAAAMADIPLYGLIEEPVAAALHYGMQSGSKDQVIMVYDLGGGTFDATLLTMDENGVYVLSKDGITDLGGKEFDEAIAAIVMEQYEKTKGTPLVLNAINSLQLRRIAEELKIELSQPNMPFIKKMVLLGAHAFEIFLNKKDFDRAIKVMIEKTIEVTCRCMDGAGLSEGNVDALMLVGGSSMIPYVKERLSSIFSLPNQKIFFHEPMRAVAYGAALHAAQLSGDAELYAIPPEFRGVTGHNIGVQTLNPRTNKVEIDCLVKKNMPLPCSASRTYYTSTASQTKIRLQVVQYRESKEEIIPIGELVIGPIPNPHINYAIEIKLENAQDGTISIHAFDPNTGVELQKSFGNEDSSGQGSLLQQKQLVQNMMINVI